MSDTMLIGILRMPLPDNPDPLTLAQVAWRAGQAADRIEHDAAEIKRLRAENETLRAFARGPVPSLTHVLASDRGQRITYSALRSAFVRAMERAGQSGWTIHDIKAKGYSDHANGHLAAGHRSDMRRVYDRKIRTSEPTR